LIFETGAKVKKPTVAAKETTEMAEECLCDSWKVIRLDPITDANQKSDTYWKWIKDQFDERKNFGTDAMMNIKRKKFCYAA
jgi:hypothetical protein